MRQTEQFKILLSDTSPFSQNEIFVKMKELLDRISVPVLFRIITIFKQNLTTVPEETAIPVLTALVSTFDETLQKKIDSLDSVSKCISLLTRAIRTVNNLTSMEDTMSLESHTTCVEMFSNLLFFSIKAIIDILDKTSSIRKEKIEEIKKKFKHMRLRLRLRKNPMYLLKLFSGRVKKKLLMKRLYDVEKEIFHIKDKLSEAKMLQKLKRERYMLERKLDITQVAEKPLSREEKNFEKYKKISFHSDEDFKCLIKALLDPINEALDVLRKIDGDHTADIVLHSTVTSINMACHIFGGL